MKPSRTDARPVVLHVSQSTETGVAHAVVDLVQHQQQEGWRVVVASPPGRLADLSAEAGAEVLRWDAQRQPGPSVLPEMIALARLVSSVGPDVVHLHSAKAGLVGRLVLRGRLPTVYTPHAWSWLAAQGPQRRLARTWERHGARWSHVVICLSPGELADAHDAGVLQTPALVPHDVDTEALRRSAPAGQDVARRQVLPDVGATTPVAVCCARLAPQKGQDILLRAWARVSELVPDAELVLVGDGPDREALEATAAGMHGVRFAGPATRLEARAWLRAATVVVCPSRYEGMSLVPLECAALGVPVIASDVEGMDSDLPSSARRLVPPEDDLALAAALLDVLTHPDEAALGGHAAEAWSQAAARLPSSQLRTLALYEYLLGRPRRVAA